MLIQGTNVPLVVIFDADISAIPILVITLWGRNGYKIKQWNKDDMTVDEDTASLPITEDESAAFPAGSVILEAKGLTNGGTTIFWDEVSVAIRARRDKVIRLTQSGEGL